MSERGSGRTTKQILAAPEGAVFVAGSERDRDYARSLAGHLGRLDLKIESVSFFEDRWHGHRKPVVLDHAIWRPGCMTMRQDVGQRAMTSYLLGHGISVT